VSDFEVMLMKKKEMSKKRKRKADIDIINDNDDIIDQLLADMRHAAEVSNCVGLCCRSYENFHFY
jgi:transcription factor SPN1